MSNGNSGGNVMKPNNSSPKSPSNKGPSNNGAPKGNSNRASGNNSMNKGSSSNGSMGKGPSGKGSFGTSKGGSSGNGSKLSNHIADKAGDAAGLRSSGNKNPLSASEIAKSIKDGKPSKEQLQMAVEKNKDFQKKKMAVEGAVGTAEGTTGAAIVNGAAEKTVEVATNSAKMASGFMGKVSSAAKAVGHAVTHPLQSLGAIGSFAGRSAAYIGSAAAKTFVGAAATIGKTIAGTLGVSASASATMALGSTVLTAAIAGPAIGIGMCVALLAQNPDEGFLPKKDKCSVENVSDVATNASAMNTGDNEKIAIRCIWATMDALGYDENQRMGILLNMKAESGWDPTVVESWYLYAKDAAWKMTPEKASRYMDIKTARITTDRRGVGLCGFTYLANQTSDEMRNLQDYCEKVSPNSTWYGGTLNPKAVSDENGKTTYPCDWLEGLRLQCIYIFAPDSNMGKTMADYKSQTAGKSVYDCTYWFTKNYERPRDTEGQARKRASDTATQAVILSAISGQDAGASASTGSTSTSNSTGSNSSSTSNSNSASTSGTSGSSSSGSKTGGSGSSGKKPSDFASSVTGKPVTESKKYDFEGSSPGSDGSTYNPGSHDNLSDADAFAQSVVQETAQTASNTALATAGADPECEDPTQGASGGPLSAAGFPLAWYSKDAASGNDGTKLYQYVMTSVNAAQPWQSCDRGAQACVRFAGIDKEYPNGGVSNQYTYMQESPKWERVIAHGQPVTNENMQFGDILIITASMRGRAHGHIRFFAGHEALAAMWPSATGKNVEENTDLTILAASYLSRSLGCEPLGTEGGYEVWRCKTPDNDMTLYNQCESYFSSCGEQSESGGLSKNASGNLPANLKAGSVVPAKYTGYHPDEGSIGGGWYAAYNTERLVPENFGTNQATCAAPKEVPFNTFIKVIGTGNPNLDNKIFRVNDRGGAINVDAGVYHFDILARSVGEMSNCNANGKAVLMQQK